MSAFTVSNEHIAVMVGLAMEGPADGNGRWYRWIDKGDEGAEQVAVMLREQNARSVRALYGQKADDGGCDSEWFTCPSDWRGAMRRRRPTALEALKLVHCYEYQACETEDWRSTEAAEFCRALTRALVSRLPGYDAAPWAWPG